MKKDGGVFLRRTIKMILFMIPIVILNACLQEVRSDEQMILVRQYSNMDAEYVDFNEVTDWNKVQKVNKLLIQDIEWSTSTEELEKPADYLFYFRYTDPSMEAKTVTYYLWNNTEQEDQVELMRDGDYVKLNSDQSMELMEILTEK